MLRTKIVRISLVIFGAGCFILGTSLTTWLLKGPHNLYYTRYSYEWVVTAQSDKPATASDELWRE